MTETSSWHVTLDTFAPVPVSPTTRASSPAAQPLPAVGVRRGQAELSSVIHRLTPAGRAELDRWLGEPAIPARGYRDDFFLKIMAAVRSGDPATLSCVLSRQRACLLRQLHALADARATTSTTAVESLLITAAELHIRADLGVVNAAETTLTTDLAPVSEQASSGMTPPQSAAG